VLAETSWPRLVGLSELPWRGVPALTRRATEISGERWFAVGDAAGYVEPFTGEGMAWALMSSSALAPIAARAIQNWEPGLSRDWAHTYRRVLGTRQRMCRVVSRVLRSPVLMKIAVRATSMFPVLARPIVSALNRPPLLGAPA
jgi:flavin-dependent dehydrogenase